MAFDASEWRSLNLPHDWGVEGEVKPGQIVHEVHLNGEAVIGVGDDLSFLTATVVDTNGIPSPLRPDGVMRFQSLMELPWTTMRT